MFDPDLYRKTCSESLRLSEETLEEMIAMTENKKRTVRRPLQIALTAAALAVVMCVTAAAAANPEAVRQLWKSFSVSIVYQDEDVMVFQSDMAEISVERVDGRVMLTVDGAATDITEALDRDGVYTQTFENEYGTGELTVNSDLTWGVTMPIKDGGEFSYGSETEFTVNVPADLEEAMRSGELELGLITVDGESCTSYTFTDDENVTDAAYLPPEE